MLNNFESLLHCCDNMLYERENMLYERDNMLHGRDNMLYERDNCCTDRKTCYTNGKTCCTNGTTCCTDTESAIGVLLGNGWYNHQSKASWDYDRAPWRARPRFCLNMRITYEDNTVETFYTDTSWKTSLSPVIFNSIYTGEQQDARLNQKGWNIVNFDDSNWKKVIIVKAPSNNIVAQVLCPIRYVEEITPKSVCKINNEKYIFDLGRNISGITQIHVKGKRGTTIRLKHSEILDANGNVDQSNITTHYHPANNTDPFQTDIYTLSGEGAEILSPHFNYKGFQYVEVTSNNPIELTKNSLKGIFMHSDVPAIGKIESSNNTLNKIWEATNNS